MTPSIETLTLLEGQGLVHSVPHPHLPLRLWCADVLDDSTRHVHALVTDDSGAVIGKGLPHFDSVREVEMPPRTEPFVVTDMVDGVGVHVALHEGELLLWDARSFTGDHLDEAREMLSGWKPREGTTVLFEAVLGTRTIDYGGFRGLVLIAEVEHATLKDWSAPQAVADRTGWWGEVVTERTIHAHMLLKLLDNPENGDGWLGFVLVYPRRDAPALRFSARFVRHESGGR